MVLAKRGPSAPLHGPSVAPWAPPEPSASRPAQKQSRAGAAGEGPMRGRKSTGLITPTLPLQWGSMFRGPPRADKGTKKAFFSRSAGEGWGP